MDRWKFINVFLIEYLNALNNIKKAMIATSGGDKTWKEFLEQSKLSSLDNISNSPLITAFKFDKLFNNNKYANFQNKDGFRSTIWANDLQNLNNFENDNPRFDRDWFIAACRPTEGQDELRRLGKPGEEYASILP